MGEKVRIGVIVYSPTHIHFLLPPDLAGEVNNGVDEMCFLLEAGASHVCTAPPASWEAVDFYKTFASKEEARRYIENFTRRVEKSRERGLLPASWTWIQRHVRP